MKIALAAAIALAALPLGTDAAEAAPYTFVGSWQVDDGPFWRDEPLAYSGQEAAALLFGGNPSNYVISTLGALVEDIDFNAWYSILGVAGGFRLPHDLDQALPGGLYYDGNDYVIGLMTNPASAFVWDNAGGPEYTNYAFRISEVPLPATAFLLLAGLGGLALLRRKATAA